MTSVFWTPQADEDLASIYGYISYTSERYAEVMIHDLIASVGACGISLSLGASFPSCGVPTSARSFGATTVWCTDMFLYGSR